MPTPPPAYKFAKAHQRSLRLRYANLSRSLSDDGGQIRLRTFQALLDEGCPAINMSLAGAVRFLDTGEYLNIYEVVALQVGEATGPEFRKALKKRLGSWYRPRRIFDRLLRFDRNTHYASLNLGSGGPGYGEFCVKFGPSTPLEFGTCFAGDPLRYIFDNDGNQILKNSDIYRRFATFEDGSRLAAVHCKPFLEQTPIIDRDKLIKILDDRETLLEIHIHANINRDNIQAIAVQPDYYEKLCRRCIELERLPRYAHKTKRFADARLFKRFLELVTIYGLTLFAERG